MRAVISPCGAYRYTLGRTWAPSLSRTDERVLFVMLNPSTADAKWDDPTIRRCIGFAKAWGFGGLDVANLFSLRSTLPAGLLAHPEPIGPENDLHIGALAGRAPLIITAWGDGGKAGKLVPARAREVLALIDGLGKTTHHLGLTQKAEQPRHPLYLSKETKPTARVA